MLRHHFRLNPKISFSSEPGSFWRQCFTQRAATPLPEPQPQAQVCNGLAQFFQHLATLIHPNVLDLGRVWHSTVTLLTAAGCKVYTEDVLATLASTLEKQSQDTPPLVATYLEENLRYPAESFDAILAWDLFDYLPEELLTPAAERLRVLLKANGVLLALFHNSLPTAEGVKQYRLLTAQSFACMPSTLPLVPQRVFHNRTILRLFTGFSSSRTFIRRDNLREVLLVK